MAAKEKADVITIPSVLAFEKKLVPSDAQMFAVSWEARTGVTQPLKLQEKSVRGTISNRLSTKEADPAKLDASIENANIQTVDYCALPSDKDTLKVRFTLKVLSGIEQPSACNGQDFQASYAKAVSTYIEKTGFKELAQRYAINIANARFLWRNRVGAEQIKVVVKHINNGNDKPTVWEFDAKDIGLAHFESDKVQALAEIIAKSLATDFALLDIEAYSQLGEGQEVYPSEELVTEKGDKSKILYETDGVAALHSQKVGNALRTIDTWYDGTSNAKPIAVEVYGSVTNQGTAYRKPKPKGSQDFYTLFDQFAVGGDITEDAQHYVMAMLVRGGVFGKSSK
jgi:CRISPR-associated protein Csy3